MKMLKNMMSWIVAFVSKKDRELEELVVKEALSIKFTAKPFELEKLNFKGLNPDKANCCIYGQLTGNCFNFRACDLIYDCAPRVYKPKTDENRLGNVYLNGAPEKISILEERLYWSPIEVFIFKKRNRINGNNKRLINYLKGKTNNLKLR